MILVIHNQKGGLRREREREREIKYHDESEDNQVKALHKNNENTYKSVQSLCSTVGLRLGVVFFVFNDLEKS